MLFLFLSRFRDIYILTLLVVIFPYLLFSRSMYWHPYVEPGLGSLLYFLSVPWKMYTFSCCFSVVAQSNIRQWPVLLQNHPPQISIQSNHIAPPNWNLFSFITWSQRCDRRRIHAFPLHFSVLNLYPHRSPSIPTMATNWSPTVCDGSYALASLDPNTCGKYVLKTAGLQLASLLCMGSTSRHVTSRCGSCNPVTRTPYYIIRLMYTVFSTFVTTQSNIR